MLNGAGRCVIRGMSTTCRRVHVLNPCGIEPGSSRLQRWKLLREPQLPCITRRQFLFSRRTSGHLKIGKVTKVILGAALIGGGMGAYVTYQEYLKIRKPIMNTPTGCEFFLDKGAVPEHQISRVVSCDADPLGIQLTLYQYQSCPFCCKVRAFLDYYGLPYNVIEVNPVFRQQMTWSKWKKVPVLLASSDNGFYQLNDSSMIISSIMSLLHDKKKDLHELTKCFPYVSYMKEDGKEVTEILNKYNLMFQDAPVDRTKDYLMEEKKWRKWSDDVLVHSLSPNIYRTVSEALQAFTWFSQVGEWEKHFSWFERNVVIYVGATAMYFIGRRLKKRHQLKDDVRISLYDDCNHWMRALKRKGTPFMGGDKPNLADLAVYGTLSSIEGCQAFEDVQRHTKIGPWFQQMKEAVKQHEGQLLFK